MIGDTIRAILDLLMLRKTEKKLDADIAKAPLDRQKLELDIEKAQRDRAAWANVIIPPDKLSIDDIQRYDPRAAAIVTKAKQLSAFVSFARSDGDVARSLRTALKQQGLSVNADDDHLHAGGDFQDQRTSREIKESDAFVVLLSQKSVDSNYVREEIEFAFRQNKRIVPVYVEGFQEQSLMPELFERLRNTSALHLNAMNMDEVVESIVVTTSHPHPDHVAGIRALLEDPLAT